MNTVARYVATTDDHGDRLAYTFTEAAHLLGVSRQTVARMCTNGRLHQIDTGTSVRLVAAWSLCRLIDDGRGPASRPLSAAGDLSPTVGVPGGSISARSETAPGPTTGPSDTAFLPGDVAVGGVEPTASTTPVGAQP